MELQMLGRCVFCDKPVVDKSAPAFNLSNLEEFEHYYGQLPVRLGGKVGNKLICDDCCVEIRFILSE